MPASPPEEVLESEETTCDFCGKWVALIHCRADDARLCLACDRHVHAANTVAFKHLRSLLCNSCNSASSTILCSTHQLVFCHNCDFQSHIEDNHERRSVEPFSGSPSSLELLDVLGVGDDEKSFVGLDCVGDCDEVARERESWVWETAPVLSWDDLVIPTSDQHPFKAVGVPPLPKNRNSSCGKQKEEILRQIQSMIKSEASINNQFWEDEGYDHQTFQTENGNLCTNDVNADLVGTCEDNWQDNILVWQNDSTQHVCSEVPFTQDYLSERSMQDNQTCHDTVDGADGEANRDNSGSSVQEHLISGEDALVLPSKSVYELFGADRDIALTRYKEKRKTRRYDKHVRYESRKARAEGRVRIRGRFAKVSNRNPRDGD